MKEIFYLLMMPVWCSSIALTITDLTDVGNSIGIKPFNCFVCMAWWLGLIGTMAITWDMMPVNVSIPVAIGSGGMSVIYAYFIKRQIWKR